MSDADILISYNSSLPALEKELLRVKHSGNYFTAGSHETPMPLVRIDGATTLSFPVQEEQASQVVRNMAELAPYGRGDRTLVDQEVRKVWQVDASRLSITGKGWERAFEVLLEEVARQLGCGEMSAELYKLLIYDKGGHFAAHRDTEKAPGMFGTLVISLPAFHQGGDLAIRHHGRETTLSLTCEDPGEIRYAAFYADCEHEVYPITEGYRVCLIYNLVSKEKTKLPVPDDQAVVEKVASLLQSWVTSKSDPAKLVYLLEHRYTQAAIAYSGLKGLDAARARVLQEAAAKAKCAVHLGILHIEESGWAEYSGECGYGRWRGRYGEEEYEVGEVCDGSYYIDQWRDVNDTAVDFGEIPLQDEEVLPHGCLDDAQPDEAHFSEATGNEGASFERTYLRAALVLWPEERFDEICISGGRDAAICRLGQVIIESRSSDPAVAKAAKKRLAHLMTLLPEWWSPYADHSAALEHLLRHLTISGDPKLIAKGVRQAPLFEYYHAGLHLPLLLCMEILPRKERGAFLIDLLKAITVKKPAAALELWSRMASHFAEEQVLLRETLEVLLDECPKVRILKTSNAFLGWLHRLDSLDQQIEEAKLPKSALTPALLADFFRAVSTKMGHDWALRVISSIEKNLAFFAPDTLLLPTLELLVQEELPPLPCLALWEQCAAFYLNRSATAPVEPTDWALPMATPLPGREPLLRELEKFARDPEAREHRFRVRKEIRQILHRAIDEAGLDMDHMTLRVGSPQTLVCTKNRASYKRAYEQYQRDLADMRRLLGLPVVNDALEAAQKLSTALANETPRYCDEG